MGSVSVMTANLIAQSGNVLVRHIDSLRLTTEQGFETLQVQASSLNSISGSITILAQGQSVQQAQVDTLTAKLSEIAENGIGYSGAISYIAFPLIIALFAFAFTYLFSVITRINEKYGSEHISRMFKSCMPYRCYMWGSGISVGYIILMAVLSLAFTGGSHHVFLAVMNWSCVLDAGAYAGIILWFVIICLQYDDHYKMLGLIEARYQKDKNKSSSLKERTSRLTDLCRYAIRTQNEDLLSSVLRKVNELDKAERDLKGKNVAFFTMMLYESIVDGFIQYPRDGETERNLLWNWFQTFRRDKLPITAVVFRMLGKMVEAVKQGRFSLYEAYVEKCRLGLDFINRIPIELYAAGRSVKEQTDTDEERYKILRELREVHYIAAAYMFSVGHFEVASVYKKGAGYHRDTLFPSTVSSILRLYAYCKENQDDESGVFYRYFSLDKVIGYKYDRDILEKFTAMMLLLATQHNEGEGDYIINETKRKILLDSKDSLVKFGKLWQKHSEIISLYPILQERKIDKQYEEGLNHLTTGQLQEEKDPKSLISLLSGKKAKKNPLENIYDLKITTKDVEPIRQLFNTLLYSNRSSLADGLDGVVEEGKEEQIAMGSYTFLSSKKDILASDIWRDHSVFNDMLRVFRARYFYVLYEALSNMKVKDVTIKWDKFEQMFIKHVGDKANEYVIIDNDSSMDVMITMDKPKDGAKWSFNRYYKGAYYYNAGRGTSLYLEDVPLVDSFDKTILIGRFSDLPTPISVAEGGLPKVSFNDESNKEKGWAAVRITVDPCLVAKYSKNADFLRVRVKWK